MTAAVCANCEHVLVEHGRGHVHFDTGNYRCVGYCEGDGFARPAETLLFSEEIEAAYQDGYVAGFADA